MSSVFPPYSKAANHQLAGLPESAHPPRLMYFFARMHACAFTQILKTLKPFCPIVLNAARSGDQAFQLCKR